MIEAEMQAEESSERLPPDNVYIWIIEFEVNR